ncbi:MAG: T9SS type A sorting domain-containing protein [Bacteroidota bacterium]
MRYTKAIIFSVLMLLVGQLALAQQHDVFAQPQDPIKLVKIFPNPAVDYLSVKFETPLAKTIKLTLHNIIGNTLEVESEIVDEYEIRLKVKDLPTGVYLLAVKDHGNSQSSFKFLKR